MAKQKATHYGHCQVCGSRQKLPNGRLAKHGYTLEYGFFNGTCFGSNELPYELSCELVKEAKGRALARIDELTLRADTLRTADYSNVNTAWQSVYFPATFARGARGGYRWLECEITCVARESNQCLAGETEPHKWYEFYYTYTDQVGKTKQNRINFYGEKISDTPTMVRRCNSKYAETFDRIAAQAKSYVVDCTRRIKDWKLAELTPVEEK
jgi:hypothetical protein